MPLQDKKDFLCIPQIVVKLLGDERKREKYKKMFKIE